MLGQLGAGDVVARPALVGIEIGDGGERRAELGRRRPDIGTDPFRDRLRHRAAQRRRRVNGHLGTVGHQNAVEPDKVDGGALRRLRADRQRLIARDRGETLVAGQRLRQRQRGGRRHLVQLTLQLLLQIGVAGPGDIDSDDQRRDGKPYRQHP